MTFQKSSFIRDVWGLPVYYRFRGGKPYRYRDADISKHLDKCIPKKPYNHDFDVYKASFHETGRSKRL